MFLVYHSYWILNNTSPQRLLRWVHVACSSLNVLRLSSSWYFSLFKNMSILFCPIALYIGSPRTLIVPIRASDISFFHLCCSSLSSLFFPLLISLLNLFFSCSSGFWCQHSLTFIGLSGPSWTHQLFSSPYVFSYSWIFFFLETLHGLGFQWFWLQKVWRPKHGNSDPIMCFEFPKIFLGGENVQDSQHKRPVGNEQRER